MNIPNYLEFHLLIIFIYTKQLITNYKKKQYLLQGTIINYLVLRMLTMRTSVTDIV